jgi:hypothetical protein
VTATANWFASGQSAAGRLELEIRPEEALPQFLSRQDPCVLTPEKPPRPPILLRITRCPRNLNGEFDVPIRTVDGRPPRRLSWLLSKDLGGPGNIIRSGFPGRRFVPATAVFPNRVSGQESAEQGAWTERHTVRRMLPLGWR